MNALPVALLLLVEDGVLVLRQHLLLARHLSVPPLHGLCALSVASKSSAESIDDAVHGAQALALPGFLWRGKTPWGLPVMWERQCQSCMLSDFRNNAYQRRPENRAEVGLNMATDVKWRVAAGENRV